MRLVSLGFRDDRPSPWDLGILEYLAKTDSDSVISAHAQVSTETGSPHHSILVHVLSCVLALALCYLLQRGMGPKGMDGFIPALLRQLAGIQEVEVVYPPTSKGGE